MRLAASLALLSGYSLPAYAGAGDHVALGSNGSFAPSIGAAFDYRTNVYRSEVDPSPAGSFALIPGFDLTAGSNDHALKLHGDWTARKFVFVGVPEGEEADVEGVSRATTLDQFNQFGAVLGAELFQQDSIGLTLNNQARLVNNSADADFSQTPFVTQLRNALDGGLRFRPGDVLTLSTLGQFTYDQFSVPAVDGQSTYNSRLVYGPELSVNYSFLPKTSFILSGEYNLHRWDQTAVAVEDGQTIGQLQGELGLPDSNHLKVRTGLQGAVTEKVRLDLLLGYGSALYLGDDSGVTKVDAGLSSGPTGLERFLVATRLDVEIASPGTGVGIFYLRDFMDSFFTNYVAYQEVGASAQAMVADRLQPSLKFTARPETYVGDLSRSDVLLRLSNNYRVVLADYASMDAGFGWQQRASSDILVEYDDWNVRVAANFVY